MFKKYSKEVFLLILVSLLLISISAISAGDVSNSTTSSPTVTVEKQVSMSNVIKEDTTDNKVLSKNSENIQTKEKTDNKKTIKKETSNVDYYVCDNSGSDSNTGSQDNPFKTIGYAVGKVNSNDNYNIHIKNGTYKGTGNTNLTIDGNKYINFIGDGINQTIIDGESEYTIQGGTVWGDDPYFNTYNITKGNWAMNITSGNGKITIKNLNFQHMVSKGGNNINAYPTATIDNYANLEVDNVYFYENLAGVGAGIRSNDGSTLVVNNSIFESNRKSSSTGNFGAGIYNNGTATIHNSQFIDNAARWGTVTNDKVLTIVNSTFRNGHAYNLASTFKFGSGIAANTGSADFYNQHNGSVTLITNITKCTFENNEQTDIYQGKGNLYVNECVFKNSTGIYIANDDVFNSSFNRVIENSCFSDMKGSSLFYSLNFRKLITFAIYNLGQANTQITNNNITVPTSAYGLYLNGYNTVENNNIQGLVYINGNNSVILNNNLTSNRSYTVELTNNAFNNSITSNNISASIFTGNMAVKSTNDNIVSDNIVDSGENITITDDNYNTYFDSEGNIQDTLISNGSRLNLQSLNNKQFNIKNLRVFITSIDGSILRNCSIYVDSTAKTTIYGLNIQNTNDKYYVIKINSKYNNIEANNITVNTNTPIHTIILLADENNIYNNTITTNGPSNNINYTGSYGVADTIGLLIQSSKNNIESNVFKTNYTTTQPYGTTIGVSIQDNITRHTNNTLLNNTITTQSNAYAYSLNLLNTDDNVITNNIINVFSDNYANAIQVVDSHNNDINAKVTINSQNIAYGVIITGNNQTSNNNIISELTISNITSNIIYGIELYNTNNTRISSNDSSSSYYLHGNYVTMIGLFKANNTEISYISPYINGKTGTLNTGYDVLKPTNTVFNIVNSTQTQVNGIKYIQKTINTIKYNSQGNYAQITNSSNIYIGKLVKEDYVENTTINTINTPILITDSQNINITGTNITTDNLYTIILNNTNNSIIKDNILLNNKQLNGADNTIIQNNCQNNTLLNNTPTINNVLYLTNNNYNTYFTNNIYQFDLNTIVLTSDIYNKNMIFNKEVTIENPNKYTIYNTTITLNKIATINNLNIVNTDTRTNTIIINMAATINNTNINIDNNNEAKIITVNGVQATITNNTITATGNIITAITLTTATNTNIYNNKITINSTKATALTATKGENIKIASNNITTHTTTPTQAITLDNLDKTYIENNTIIVHENTNVSIIHVTGKIYWPNPKKYLYIRYNYLQTQFTYGNNAITTNTTSRYNVTIDNNTPSTPLTPTKLKTKSIKTETITNDNYNQYFDENGVIKPSITEITLGSDLYNKNMTISHQVNSFANPNNYTLYNSTIILNNNEGSGSNYMGLDDIKIINTDERESAITITGSGVNVALTGLYIYQKNNGKSYAINFNRSTELFIQNVTIDMDCNEAIAINVNNKVSASIMSNTITIKTKIATPVIIGNNSYVGIGACFIEVNESSNKPIISLENYNPEDEEAVTMVIYNYLETPFAKGDDTVNIVNSTSTFVTGNIPSEENSMIPVNIAFSNKLYKGVDNYINITVVDLFGNKINEGIVSVKINDTEIGTATVKDGLASIRYKPIETGNYTINVNYTCDSGKYAHLNWIIDFEVEEYSEMFSLEQVNTTGILEYADAVASITMNPIVSCLNNVINVSSSITFNGNNVNGGRVVFKVNGKTLKDADGNIQYVKVVDGKAVIENVIVNSNWLRQNPTITTVYSGNGIILGSTYTDIMNITKAKAHIELEPQTAEEKSQITITAKITNEIINENSQTNNQVTGGRVIFKINGRTLKDSNNNVIYATVENGVASITYTIPSTLKSKEYTLSCVYGHKLYERSEGNTTLTVVKS